MKGHLCYFVLLLHFPISSCTNAKLLNIEPYLLSDVMKQFMIRIIQENSHEKDGFLFIAINKVVPEFSDFAIKKLNEIASVILIDFGVNRNMKPLLNPNHFKFVLTDPLGDLSYANDVFKKVRVSRAKIVLILTRKPHPFFITYVLNSYANIKCTNVIVVFESDGKIEVMTHNPFLKLNKKIVKLTDSPVPFFYDKTRNLHGSKIRCLLTYSDRTKIKKVRKNGNLHYEGKDYNAIQTILTHLNGKLEVVTMDNVLLNPWFESIPFNNRSNRKINILNKKDIAILIKSEQFSVDDKVVENLYPHTQNDLSVLVPKSSKLPMKKMMLTVYTPWMWVMNMLISLLFLFLIVVVRTHVKTPLKIQKLFFEVFTIPITSNIGHFPKNFIERMLIFGWIGCGFIITMFLQSKITSFLAIRKYYPDINTIEELYSSGLPLYALPNYAEEVEKKYIGTKYENFAKNLIPLGINEGLMDHMTYNSDVEKIPAFIIEYDIALFVSRCRRLSKKGTQIYHLVKESIIPNYQSYKVIHNSPLLPILNKKLRRLEEGGFIELWAKRALYNATLEGFLYPENYDETEVTKPLSLEVTLIWFYIVIIGLFFANIVFVVEIIVYKVMQPKKIIFLN